MQVCRAVLILLHCTTCWGQEGKSVSSVGPGLAAFVPKEVNSVLSWDLSRPLKSQTYKREWENLSDMIGLPLERIKRFTRFRKYEGGYHHFDDELQLVEADGELAEPALIEKLKSSAGTKAVFKTELIGTTRVFASTIPLQGRQDPWVCFCFPKPNTILISLRGTAWMSEVLQRTPKTPQTKLQESLTAITDFGAVTLLMDLREQSSRDEPMFAIFHGNGMYPTALGSPQQLLLNVSTDQGLTARLSVECKSPAETDHLIESLNWLKSHEIREVPPSEEKHPLEQFADKWSEFLNSSLVAQQKSGSRVTLQFKFDKPVAIDLLIE